MRDINNLIPVIPKNVGLDFDNSDRLILSYLKLSPRRDLKVFEIKLQK